MNLAVKTSLLLPNAPVADLPRLSRKPSQAQVGLPGTQRESQVQGKDGAGHRRRPELCIFAIPRISCFAYLYLEECNDCYDPDLQLFVSLVGQHYLDYIMAQLRDVLQLQPWFQNSQSTRDYLFLSACERTCLHSNRTLVRPFCQSESGVIMRC
ncbi:hypothetical protein BV22DRAFT_576477 [Leucogyrophana mollusca]|uniref:Uncharacterized protein n=1 Tax=Leucogyrophana mollusca TaxID=85980 RepID=A0ACB8BDB0_9AGAM|nr:hypothetical protein BV22DRAFT_576477 [Leucogyrophana mollusca]